MDKKEYMAEWSAAYINDLPDSAFLYIAPGGEKDDDGRTTPRSLRYFPVRDEKGQIDLPHLRNAIAQAPKANLSPEIISKVQAEGRKMLEGTREEKMDDYDKVDEEMKRARSMEDDEEEMQMSDWSGALRLDDVSVDKVIELARSGSHYGRASDRLKVGSRRVLLLATTTPLCWALSTRRAQRLLAGSSMFTFAPTTMAR